MKSTVGKNIVRLKGEQGMSQRQLAQKIHATWQAVFNWEAGRSQPDLDILETLVSAFGTDISVVIYGQIPAGTDEETRFVVGKRHLKRTVFRSIPTLASYLVLTALEQHLDMLKARTYNFMSYILLQAFVIPLISVEFTISLTHALNVADTVRIAESDVRKRLLIVGGLTAALYMPCMLWLFVPLPLFLGTLLWTRHMSFSIVLHILFLSIGLLLHLGLDHGSG